jgi:hypothetical protein
LSFERDEVVGLIDADLVDVVGVADAFVVDDVVDRRRESVGEGERER